MIKAKALNVISMQESNKIGLASLIVNKQNIIIESSNDTQVVVPDSVSDLAVRLLKYDELIKEIINELRMLYTSKREDFHISLSQKSKEEKEIIVSLFQDMYGIISVFHYMPEIEMLNGKIIISPRAQAFITGQYLEIAVYKRTVDIIKRLAVQYGKAYKVYHNVKVATCEGRLKNEFDVVVEFNGFIYVIEIKSGRNFREFDKYMYIGREYNIVPDRFLLVDNYLTNEHAKTIEYFCNYYVCNLTENSLETKLTKMIENDLKEGNDHV